jgi:hypothetical protein
MYIRNQVSARLLAWFLITLVPLLTSSNVLQLYYQPAYSHILSLDENASLLKLFHEIYVQVKLTETIFPLDIDQAHEHVKDGIETLSSKNWTTVAADRDIVHNSLVPSLNLLEELTRPRSELSSQADTSRSLSSFAEIKGEAAALDNILSQFTILYIGDRVYKNSTIQAMIISELANDISEKYGRAFGVAVNSSNMMAMMAMPTMVMNGKQASPASYNMMSNSKYPTMHGMMTTNMTMNSNTKKASALGNNSNNTSSNKTIIDTVDYQTAQALATEALEIFNKELKPGAPLDTVPSNMEVQKYLEQLKDAIDNRASVMDIMAIIHGHIHPILIATYKLQLKS